LRSEGLNLVLKTVSNQNRALYFEMGENATIYKLKCTIATIGGAPFFCGLMLLGLPFNGW
jgi:hypothetical protein